MMLDDWNVLVVEDEPDSMDLVQSILSYHGAGCMVASNAEVALDLLQNTVPTVIIIDLALPGMNGWELLQQIRQDTRLSAVPCAAITAYHATGMDDEVLDAGFDAYFPKPLDATHFVGQLVQLLKR
jgi:CheY-like chemotaxis protein